MSDNISALASSITQEEKTLKRWSAEAAEKGIDLRSLIVPGSASMETINGGHQRIAFTMVCQHCGGKYRRGNGDVQLVIKNGAGCPDCKKPGKKGKDSMDLAAFRAAVLSDPKLLATYGHLLPKVEVGEPPVEEEQEEQVEV